MALLASGTQAHPLLVIPFVCLALFDVVKGAPRGLYCGIGFLAMLGPMLYRPDQYAVDALLSDGGK